MRIRDASLTMLSAALCALIRDAHLRLFWTALFTFSFTLFRTVFLTLITIANATLIRDAMV